MPRFIDFTDCIFTFVIAYISTQMHKQFVSKRRTSKCKKMSEFNSFTFTCRQRAWWPSGRPTRAPTPLKEITIATVRGVNATNVFKYADWGADQRPFLQSSDHLFPSPVSMRRFLKPRSVIRWSGAASSQPPTLTWRMWVEILISPVKTSLIPKKIIEIWIWKDLSSSGRGRNDKFYKLLRFVLVLDLREINFTLILLMLLKY